MMDTEATHGQRMDPDNTTLDQARGGYDDLSSIYRMTPSNGPCADAWAGRQVVYTYGGIT